MPGYGWLAGEAVVVPSIWSRREVKSGMESAGRATVMEHELSNSWLTILAELSFTRRITSFMAKYGKVKASWAISLRVVIAEAARAMREASR